MSVTRTVNRIRRNHGLEHATIHVLSESHKRFSAQGNSDHRGFHLNIYGDVTAEEVSAAAAEAQRRLRAGQRQLAVHPNCGTVLVTTATLATLAAQAALTWEQWRAPAAPAGRGRSLTNAFNALPGAILAVVVALIIGRPLGLTLQERYTVDGDIADLEILSIQPVSVSPVARLFQLLLTAGNRALPPKSYFVRTVGGEE